MKKKFPKKPVEFGLFLIEYRESKDGMLKFLKERIDTFEDAQRARDTLLQQGRCEPIIRKIG
jgi:hypothetical protein